MCVMKSCREKMRRYARSQINDKARLEHVVICGDKVRCRMELNRGRGCVAREMYEIGVLNERDERGKEF